jgi:hypothetical protein
MSDQQAPTNDLAVLGFCELMGLMFGLPPSEALYRGEPISARMLLFALIGIIFAALGPLWPKLKRQLPRRFSARFVRVASDFQWWMILLITLFFSQVFSDLTRETQHAATTGEALLRQESSFLNPSATPTPPVVFLNFGPLYFAGIVKNRSTEAQVRALVKPYLGKWMKIVGKVKNVREPEYAGSPFQGETDVVFTFDQGGKQGAIIVQATFDKSWHDRVSQLNAGDQISVVGELTTVYQDGSFVLDNCTFTLESGEKSNAN